MLKLKDQLNQGLNLGLDDIRNTHVWEVDTQPAVNEILTQLLNKSL